MDQEGKRSFHTDLGAAGLVKRMKVRSRLTAEIPRTFWRGIVPGQFAADRILLCSIPPAQGLLEQDREPSLSLQCPPERPQSEGAQVTQVS